MNDSLIYSFVMLLAGIGIPVMAALNGRLGVHLQSPASAAAILFLVGFVLVILYLYLVDSGPQISSFSSAPWYLFTAGFFVVFYILTITWIAPKFGVANAVAFVLLGQMIAMTAIDHFGFAGNLQSPITMQRAIGLIVMSIGVFLVLSRPQSTL